MAKSDSYNISMTTVKLSVASPGLRRPGREVRHDEAADRVGLGGDRPGARSLGEQLRPHPLTARMGAGVRPDEGASGGLAQPLVERHLVALRVPRPQSPGDPPHAHRGRPTVAVLQPVNAPPIKPGSIGELLLRPVAPFEPEHHTERAREADLLGPVRHPVPPFARARRVTGSGVQGALAFVVLVHRLIVARAPAGVWSPPRGGTDWA